MKTITPTEFRKQVNKLQRELDKLHRIRDREIVSMSKKGMTYVDIASKWKISPVRARAIVLDAQKPKS